MTLNQLLKVFENFSRRTASKIKGFSYADPKKIKDNNILYPLMITIPSVQTISTNDSDGGSIHSKINVLFLDRINPKNPRQIREVYSDMFERCKLLKAYLENNDTDGVIDQEEDVNFEPVGDEINTDFVAGWGTEISVILDYDPSVCEEQLELDGNIIQVSNYSAHECSCSGSTTSAYYFSSSTPSNIIITTGNSNTVDISLSSELYTNSLTTDGLNINTANGNIFTGQYIQASQAFMIYDNLLDTYVNLVERLDATYAPSYQFRASAVTSAMFTGTTKKCTVIFQFSDSLFPSQYSVTVTGEDARTWSIESKSIGRFTISSNSTANITGTTYWQATAYRQ